MEKFLDLQGLSSVWSKIKSALQGYLPITTLEPGNGDGSVQTPGSSAAAEYASAIGYQCQSSAPYSHAEGNSCVATANSSHAEGNRTTANAYFSHTEGNGTSAEGNASHAEGIGNTATIVGSHAEGRYCKPDAKSIHTIGIGQNNQNRCNAVQVYFNADDFTDEKNGYLYLKGIGGYDGTNLVVDGELNPGIKSVQEVLANLG